MYVCGCLQTCVHVFVCVVAPNISLQSSCPVCIAMSRFRWSRGPFLLDILVPLRASTCLHVPLRASSCLLVPGTIVLEHSSDSHAISSLVCTPFVFSSA